jgi:hypothetical protein
MALNPVVIKNSVTVAWDGVAASPGVRLQIGQVLDSPAASGSNLLQTIGAANYTALTANQTAGSPGVDDGLRNQNVRSGVAYSAGQN